MVRLVLGHMVDVLSPSIYCNDSYHSLLLVVSIAELWHIKTKKVKFVVLAHLGTKVAIFACSAQKLWNH